MVHGDVVSRLLILHLDRREGFLMKRIYSLAFVFVLALSLCGCNGEVMLRTKGKLIKDGADFVPKVDDYLQVTFIPVLDDGSPPLDLYYADVDQDTGIFMPAGKNKKGMPPGKYQVAVELMRNKKDLFGGKFNTENTPYVVDVDPETEEIVIDIDHPPGA